jgi:hypothetical protein
MVDKMIIVKEGSKWSAADGKRFHVIHVVDVDGRTWVHYEQDGVKESREFSCYLESFLERFKAVLE